MRNETEKKYTLLESFSIFVLAGAMAIPMAAVVAAVLFPVALLTAWIRWLLWGWFAVPFLHLPPVPYWAMIGLGMLAGTFYTSDQPNGYEPTTKENVTRFLGVLVAQLIALGIGYIIHRHI